MNLGFKISGTHPDEEDGADAPQATATEAVVPYPPDFTAEPWDEEAEAFNSASPARWVLPAAAILGGLLWVGAMLWHARGWLASLPEAVQFAEFVAALCVPPALIGILWLLFQRTSAAEARRFGDVARAMRVEAEALERTVATLSYRIDASRDEVADRTAALMHMGERASTQLHGISIGMAHESEALERSATRISQAAECAQQRLGALLQALPDARVQVEETERALDQAGAAAVQRAGELETQVTRLAERAHEADTATAAAAERLAQHLARMEATGDFAGARLETVAATMVDTIEAVLERTSTAVDEARTGLALQGDAVLDGLRAGQQLVDEAGRQGADALDEKITLIEQALHRIGTTLGERQQTSTALLNGLADGIVEIDHRFEALHANGVDRSQGLAASLSALSGVIDAMTDAMQTGDDTARMVIGTTETLLVSLDAATREMDETMPGALDRLDGRISASRRVVAESKPELLALVTAAESTHDAIEAIAGVVSAQRDTLANVSRSLLETLDSGRNRIGEVQGIVDDTVANTRRFAEEAAPQLIDALRRIRESAASATEEARRSLVSVIPEAANKLEQEGSEALARAVDRSITRQVAELGTAAKVAVDAAQRASERLSHQMLDLTETTRTMEARLVEARAEREAADSDNLARRVSLLIEALNSSAIDITRAFAQDVSDTAWAAYLKGDRGVFTRRAVRIVDANQAREIAQLYGTDSAFHDQVNRYIHDFEAMLRQILTLRDGSPLGVTLLSSDMGKLYVALAQAIERLRT